MSKNKKSKRIKLAKSIPDEFKEWHLRWVEYRFKSLDDETKERMKNDEEYRKQILLWVMTGIVPKE